MKTHLSALTSFRSLAPVFGRPALVGMLAVALLQPSHAAERPVGVIRSGAPAGATVWLDPGAIVVTAPDAPAVYSVDRGQGQVQTRLDRAQEFSKGSVSTVVVFVAPPVFFTDFGASGLVLSPAAALAGAAAASGNRITSEALTRVESNLDKAMASMAAQSHLRDAVLKAASAQTHRRFVPMQALGAPTASNVLVAAVLESKLEELRLERTGKDDESFALRIKARARVVRVSDGKALYDDPFEYQSETALFLDWSLGDSVRNVALTGYRKLADRMAERLFLATREEPTLVGAGFRKPFVPRVVAARQPPSEMATTRGSTSVTPAAYRMANTDTFGVYATSSIPQLVIQAPLTKNQAVTSARSDISEGHLAELIEFPNPIVSVLAFGATIPIGLFKQSAAMFNGLTEEQFLAADKQISVAAYQARTHEVIALSVVQQLAPKTAQTVAVVQKPQPTGDLYQAALLQCANHGTLTALPRGVTSRDYLASQGMSKALEIHVTKAVLKGNGGINPPMALHLEATATVLRTSDGQMLYSCPVRYQGKARRFTEWANNDAKLLREEIQNSSDELGRTIATQLVARQILPPKGAPEQLLATTQP